MEKESIDKPKIENKCLWCWTDVGKANILALLLILAGKHLVSHYEV